MANAEQLALLKAGVQQWNSWFIRELPKAIDLSEANLSGANLSDAILNRATLRGADLSGADLREVHLREANLAAANLSEANLSEADFSEAYLGGVNFSKANLNKAFLGYATLSRANLSEANLSDAYLRWVNFYEANLTGADLTGADLLHANLVRTTISNARISNSYVYGINVWDLQGKFREQKDLIITDWDKPRITVDNIKVAQFIYLILDNEEIRDVINTLTSKMVLILGRFAIPERKAVLHALKNKLREYDLLPIVFDFDRPTDKDFTETIITLAGLSYFVIADVTSPKSTPLELQATVPHLQIPFVPVIQGEKPFAMMVDLQKKYHWVLDTVFYNSPDMLLKALKPAIIDPALQKHNELRLIKAREPKIRSAEDFIDKG
ncbi:MAG TPA: pentapeptide repeat-containing protein [Anaerolineales bacterium]|nr:pentapeptide repeat-containing protein [Anaerolineales bacterium]